MWGALALNYPYLLLLQLHYPKEQFCFTYTCQVYFYHRLILIEVPFNLHDHSLLILIVRPSVNMERSKLVTHCLIYLRVQVYLRKLIVVPLWMLIFEIISEICDCFLRIHHWEVPIAENNVIRRQNNAAANLTLFMKRFMLLIIFLLRRLVRMYYIPQITLMVHLCCLMMHAVII